MKVSDFNFTLPLEFIAQSPARPRDAAKLLHVTKEGNLEDFLIRDLPELLKSGDLVIVNNTRVIPALLTGSIEPKKIKFKVNLHKCVSSRIWHAFARPTKKMNVHDEIQFAPNFSASVEKKLLGGEIILKFNNGDSELINALHQFGTMPLPSYIKRPNGNYKTDIIDYQTTFANCDGAVASPTAGLHFTPPLINKLAKGGIKTIPVTLHVGAGTFLPVKTEDTRNHKMHSEWGQISDTNAKIINSVKAKGGRIVAIGTTVVRLLETAANAKGIIYPYTGNTNLFITPGYSFKTVDILLSNFHLPKTTLFMLVAAFSGLDQIKAAYDYAINNNYRFFSYGDATLLELNNKSSKS